MNRQTFRRIWTTIRLYTILSSGRRANYLKKHGIFHHIGDNCTIMERKVPLCARLISLGDNVHLASKVLLVTHDAIHLCLNNLPERSNADRIVEKLGCIEIGNNVFVGSNTTILYDVKIGSNVIIGAGSIVNKSIPDNSVAVGNPARVVGTFDEFVRKREAYSYPERLAPRAHSLSEELEQLCWEIAREKWD